jgi:hypothetical protein
MNNEITDVARGLKCGAFGAYGLNPVAFASHGVVGQQPVLIQQVGERDAADAAARPE